jgi:hypothetical protein
MDNITTNQQPLKSNFKTLNEKNTIKLNRLQKGSNTGPIINIKFPCWILACLICCKMCVKCTICKCYCCEKNDWDSMCIQLTDAICCVDSGCCTC